MKACCAALYGSDWARLLLGESLHPGGLELTGRLGALLDLGADERVLDAASGPGASAIELARRFECEVLGVDYGAESVAAATDAAARAGLADRVRFQQADAERLPLADAAFDAAICECSFCTFPDKAAAAAELFRVLRPGGRLGLSDLTRGGPLPSGLDGRLAWISCIADALPAEGYVRMLEAAGFSVELTEPHDAELRRMIAEVRARLLAAELLVKRTAFDAAGIGVDLEEASSLAAAAADAARGGRLGYLLLVARKRGG